MSRGEGRQVICLTSVFTSAPVHTGSLPHRTGNHCVEERPRGIDEQSRSFAIPTTH